MRRLRSPFVVSLALSSVLSVGCKKDEAKDDAKADAKAEQEEELVPTLEVAAGELAVEGPVPPETSMVFYVVEGALLPLACFDKEKNQLLSGKPCLDMVESGAEVRISALDSAFNKKVGERTEPQCMAGEGTKNALAVEEITEGADFQFAAWPPSALKIVHPVPDDTTSPEKTRLSDDEATKLMAAIVADYRGAKGELTAHQVAEIDVDGQDPKEKVYAVYLPDPASSEQYSWSGIFLAKGGDLDQLQLLEKSTTKRDVFEVRGTLDLDGSGPAELWMRLVFEEGGGDRVVQLEGDTVNPLGKYSCGAAR